ncbi:MAG: class I SAM-dependent methyltransferase [Christensenellales bacterium]|jgi:ubiquinone/menaquinone biosynthesis C-methylase UbiE
MQVKAGDWRRIWIGSGNSMFLSGAERAAITWARLDDYQAVLDVACDTGRVLQHIQQVRPHVRACGITGDVRAARLLRENSAAEVICAECHDIPWHNNSFHLVIAPHRMLEGPQAAENMSEMYRVLSPGGHLVVVLPFKTMLALRLGRSRAHALWGLTEAGFSDVSWRYASLTHACAIAHKQDNVQSG